MSYNEIAVVIEGALDEHARFSADNSLDALLQQRFVREAERWAAAHPGSHVEVYVTFHDHDMNVACECMQYVQDHHPVYEWNAT